ncbi:restriction endonuclease subunit S [Flexivirga oryzae]|uniref:Type I restriction enzyme S subunit n=1 Tax=Flexivirga oryzae TaxID=1794944 RepID=A0A839N593_9MICO|nr:restriction endonuclease subunit S [Flexivirga oryzae]MBB2890806.1 type I restriction enzyme S subunit [Flexivirga oryzae]
MSTWRPVAVSELAENFDRFRVPIKSSDRVVGTTPYYGASGVIDWVEGQTHDGRYLLVAEDGENLRSRSTPIAFTTRGQIWVNNHAHVLRCPTPEETEFLGYALNLADIGGYLTGSAQPKLSRRALDSIILNVPPVAERIAIAEVLGALDNKIAANRRVADQSRELAALMVSAVEPRVPLADLADAKRSTVNPTAFGNDPVLHFSLPACDVGVPERVADPSEIKSAKFELVDPCVLVSKLNPRIPRIWDVTAVPDMRCFASTEFVVLHPTDGTTSVLAAALDDPRFSVALRGKVAGTSGSHQRVKPAELMATEVADVRTLPTETAESIGRLGELRASIVEENETLAATRDGLLPLLMSGKLRVKDAEKQVGEVV